MKISKKSIAVIVTVSLLLLVVVASVAVISGWFTNYVSNIQTKSDFTQVNCPLTFHNVVLINSSYYFVIDSKCSSYHQINSMKFNNVLMNLDSNIIKGATFFQVNSSLVQNVNQIKLFTTRGFYTKTITYNAKN